MFKNADAKIELLNLDFPATKHYTDALLMMTVSGEAFIFHLEFLSSYMLELLKKSATYQEIFAEGAAKGEVKGETKGLRKGWISSIISILRTRFGDIDADALITQLQSSDDAMLNKLVVATIAVKSLEAFKELLAVPQSQAGNGQNL